MMMYSMVTWIENMAHPLVLAGFGLFILWLVLRSLSLSRAKTLLDDAIERLLYRGMHLIFILAVLLIAVGFTLSLKQESAIGNLAVAKGISTVETPPESTIPISLWLDQPAKTHFSQGDKPILYYHVNPAGLYPTEKQLWVTLFAIADDGSLTMLIPRPTNASSALNVLTETGKRYQMPRKTLEKNENAWLDLELILDQIGTEHFKLVVSPEVIVWDDEQWGDFKNHFPKQQGRDFLNNFMATVQQKTYWGEQDLKVMVE
jgi:hypothetical protein